MNQTDPLDEILIGLEVFENRGKITGDPRALSRSEAKAAIETEIAKAVREARVDENQMRLDRINKTLSQTPNAFGSPSFGSASGAMEVAGLKSSLEKRIAELKGEPHEI